MGYDVIGHRIPSAAPSMHAVRKCIPPTTRALSTSSRAAVKLLNFRVTPGIAVEPTVKAVTSPKVCDRTPRQLHT